MKSAHAFAGPGPATTTGVEGHGSLDDLLYISRASLVD